MTPNEELYNELLKILAGCRQLGYYGTLANGINPYISINIHSAPYDLNGQHTVIIACDRGITVLKIWSAIIKDNDAGIVLFGKTVAGDTTIASLTLEVACYTVSKYSNEIQMWQII